MAAPVTVSGSISARVFNVNSVIDAAFRRCKVPAQRITPEMQQIAIDALYLLMSSAPVKGVQLWALDEVEIGLLEATAGHPTPAGTIDVLSVNLRTNGFDTPLARVAQDAYDLTSNKSAAGRPTQFWLDRQRDVPVITLWPVPSAAQVASSTLAVRRKRHLMDVTNLTQTLDVPQRWHDAIIADLAARMAADTPEVDPNLAQALEAKAAMAWKLVQNAEEDSSPLTILPNIRVYTRR